MLFYFGKWMLIIARINLASMESFDNSAMLHCLFNPSQLQLSYTR